MTNKIQKIREGIEKLKSQLLRGACSSQVAMETRCKEEAYNEVLAILDNTQEEPTSWLEEFKAKVDSMSKEDFKKIFDKYAIDFEEEPVSDDLEEAAITAANEDMQGRQIMEESNENRQLYSRIFRRGFKAGAEWQKEQDQSTIELAEDHAMLAGMNKMKEEMMAKAIEGKVLANGMGNPILHLWDKGRHLIDKKVKVIVIEEENYE